MRVHTSHLTEALVAAWRGQVAATGTRRGLRHYLLQHSQELLPRFAQLYGQLRALTAGLPPAAAAALAPVLSRGGAAAVSAAGQQLGGGLLGGHRQRVD